MLCSADMLQVVFTAIVTHDFAHAGEDTGVALGHSEAEHLLKNKISCYVQSIELFFRLFCKFTSQLIV